MRLSETRYKGVWQAGYRAANDDTDDAFRRFLRDGGQITLQPYTDEFAVKLPGGIIATALSLSALARYGARQIDAISSMKELAGNPETESER